MRGSKALARPATLTKSGTGGGSPGWNSLCIAKKDRKATSIDVPNDVHDLVMVLNLVLKNEKAASNGSVRCWTSALTANRIS